MIERLHIKLVAAILLLSVIILSAGCTTSQNSKIAKINENEYSNLVAYAKNVVLKMPDRKLPLTDKQYIRKNAPEFNITYTGYKSGRFTLTWDIDNSMIIKYIGDGSLVSPATSFRRISIVKIQINSDKKILHQ